MPHMKKPHEDEIKSDRCLEVSMSAAPRVLRMAEYAFYPQAPKPKIEHSFSFPPPALPGSGSKGRPQRSSQPRQKLPFVAQSYVYGLCDTLTPLKGAASCFIKRYSIPFRVTEVSISTGIFKSGCVPACYQMTHRQHVIKQLPFIPPPKHVGFPAHKR